VSWLGSRSPREDAADALGEGGAGRFGRRLLQALVEGGGSVGVAVGGGRCEVYESVDVGAREDAAARVLVQMASPTGSDADTMGRC
jgi:hypothetical protein